MGVKHVRIKNYSSESVIFEDDHQIQIINIGECKTFPYEYEYTILAKNRLRICTWWLILPNTFICQ